MRGSRDRIAAAKEGFAQAVIPTRKIPDPLPVPKTRLNSVK
jgi:hypothetical protein